MHKIQSKTIFYLYQVVFTKLFFIYRIQKVNSLVRVFVTVFSLPSFKIQTLVIVLLALLPWT